MTENIWFVQRTDTGQWLTQFGRIENDERVDWVPDLFNADPMPQEYAESSLTQDGRCLSVPCIAVEFQRKPST